jgi:hypothetical protein
VNDYDLLSERGFLGAVLQAPGRLQEFRIAPTDLDPAYGHDRLLTAILSALDDGPGVDEIVVYEWLRRNGQAQGVGTDNLRGALYIHELVERCPSVAHVGFYAQKIREATKTRTLRRIAERLSDAANHHDQDDMIDAAAQLSIELQVTVDEPATDAPIEGLSELGAFVDEPIPPYQWVIPGVLERQDRVIFVASEGAGKTTLTRQIGILLASGRHPFEPSIEIPAKRVLAIDLENPPNLARRKTRGMVARARALSVWSDGNAFCWMKPSGLNLRVVADQQMFERVIVETRPDLVTIGPLYKMFAGGSDSYEQVAYEVSRFIDRIRERYGTALWIEHHMPKGHAGGRDLIPFGSSLWQRWPEFGLGMVPDPDDKALMVIQRFRADRDERLWPRGLTRGGDWPWTAWWNEGDKGRLKRLISGDESAMWQ